MQVELSQAKLVQEFCLAEEMFLKQKYRIQWIREGDKNTSFFHRMVKMKHCKDQIKLLIDADGNRLTVYEDISSKAVRYYMKLLGTSDTSCSGGSVEEIRDLLSFHPSIAEITMLTWAVADSKIHSTFKSFPSNKSSGPDGFIVEFFKYAWPVIRETVIQAISDFFSKGKLLKAMNSTWITLVPKCPTLLPW